MPLLRRTWTPDRSILQPVSSAEIFRVLEESISNDRMILICYRSPISVQGPDADRGCPRRCAGELALFGKRGDEVAEGRRGGALHACLDELQLSVIVHSLFSSWMLAFLFEGQILYALSMRLA